MAVIAWLTSVGVLVLRAGLGLHEHRLAMLTLVAFVCTLLVIVWYESAVMTDLLAVGLASRPRRSAARAPGLWDR